MNGVYSLEDIGGLSIFGENKGLCLDIAIGARLVSHCGLGELAEAVRLKSGRWPSESRDK